MTLPATQAQANRLQLPDGRLVRAATVGEQREFNQLQFLQLVQNARRRNPSEGRAAFNPLGERLVYIENRVRHGLTIPDVPVTLPDGSRVNLRQATGMAVFDVMKMDVRVVDERTVEVSVTSGFNPGTDVKVKDVMRPRGWSAHIDADEFALRGSPSNAENPNARDSYRRPANEFQDIKHTFVSDEIATGYHGSVARVGVGGGYGRRDVGAFYGWSFVSGVAVISLESSVQGVALILELVRTASPEALRDVFAQLSLEKRAAIMSALQSLDGGVRPSVVSTSTQPALVSIPDEKPPAAPPRGGPLEID